MKRILERITYLIIGLLIASVAYLVGNADRGVAAQELVYAVLDIFWKSC